MIASSRFWLFLAVAMPLLAASCRYCNAVGCTSGLTVQLYGDIDGGVPATPFQIDFAKLVGQQAVPLMTCTFTATSKPEQLGCTPPLTRDPLGSGTPMIYFPDTDIRMLRVTYSANGIQLAQETVSPEYTRREVWGEGCGYCSQAHVTVNLPPP